MRHLQGTIETQLCETIESENTASNMTFINLKSFSCVYQVDRPHMRKAAAILLGTTPECLARCADLAPPPLGREPSQVCDRWSEEKEVIPIIFRTTHAATGVVQMLGGSTLPCENACQGLTRRSNARSSTQWFTLARPPIFVIRVPRYPRVGSLGGGRSPPSSYQNFFLLVNSI